MFLTIALASSSRNDCFVRAIRRRAFFSSRNKPSTFGKVGSRSKLRSAFSLFQERGRKSRRARTSGRSLSLSLSIVSSVHGGEKKNGGAESISSFRREISDARRDCPFFSSPTSRRIIRETSCPFARRKGQVSRLTSSSLSKNAREFRPALFRMQKVSFPFSRPFLPPPFLIIRQTRERFQKGTNERAKVWRHVAGTSVACSETSLNKK